MVYIAPAAQDEEFSSLVICLFVSLTMKTVHGNGGREEERKEGRMHCVTRAIFYPNGHQFPHLESDGVAISNFGDEYSMILDLEQPHRDLPLGQKEAIKGNT